MYPQERDPEYDDFCPKCGKGYYFEVGFQTTCRACLQPFENSEPAEETPEQKKNDDVILDENYLLFDEFKAFRLLKQMGLLHKCQR